MRFIIDDAGDIINLSWIEIIQVAELQPEQEAPEGHTHEVLAVNPSQESYRIFSGTKAQCEEKRLDISKELLRSTSLLLI